ncbi:MAG TPA: NAD(P)/FAD-dependent oxidoreductase [Solirubrobacteraceae bacterium]|nr:NAD(P)/FAD-dependent oxidoreductase [Solirubrobacteraceae bacterium]
MEHQFDVIVVGAGPAGEVAAGRLAQRSGRAVAIVERDLVGGECSFYACMPSKALLRPAAVLAEARRVPGAAQAVSGALDVGAVLARRDEVIHGLDDAAQLPWLQERGITLFRGSARLDGERRVRVGDDLLIAREAVVLAVGSTAAMPPIPGLAEAGAWSNRQITTAREVPGRLLILGGGVVGVEMAQAWASLGSRVTVIEALPSLLANEEPFVGDEIGRALGALGADWLVGAKAVAVRRDDSGLTVELEDGRTAVGDRLLVAVGRRPLSSDLGLESVGLEGRGFVEVDDGLQVPGLPWLYAVGDVNGRALLTHMGKYQARIAADRILGERAAAVADRAGAPRVVFTDPEVAAVGRTLAAAREAGLDAVAIDLPTEGSAGGSFVGRGAEGTSRFVVDRDRRVLVGATFVGPEMSDFLHAASVAVAAEVPLRRLAHAVAAFPTRSELWLAFLEAYERGEGISLHAG